MSDVKKLRFVLGLSQKAGKLASGDFAVKAAFKEHRAKYLFLAKDASENTKKELRFLCLSAGVVCDESLTADEIGSSIGKDTRISAVLLDSSFFKCLYSCQKKF